jgi:sterol desaturase/sphingolipid hydroxylase (fatty acid hydroxylase superfamily)
MVVVGGQRAVLNQAERSFLGVVYLSVIGGSGLAALIALAVGLATEIVAVYGVLSLACQAAQHANVALPSPVERALGRIVVTPAFHAVHHSIDRVQHDSNFGTILSIWDRLLGTAMAAEPLHFGVADLGDPRYQRLPGMLLTPFA